MTSHLERAECAADRGREAVYAAEEAAFGGTINEERRSLAELQGRARAIVDGDWWRQADGPAVDVVAARVTARASSARGDRRRGVVRLAASQFDDVTIAHELAHLLAGVDHGHDEQFRAAHLDVVALLSGNRAASMLADAYSAFGMPAGRRAWPAPQRASGDTFVILP